MQIRSDFLQVVQVDSPSGVDPEISERGGRKPNSRKGGRNLTFQCRFPSFSYKSLTNIPPKGGALARPAPPLNPRLAFRSLRFAPVAQGSFAPSALTRVLRTQLQIPSAFGARLFFIYLFIKKPKLPKKICESTCNKSTVAGLL